jgi:hypothetical protein
MAVIASGAKAISGELGAHRDRDCRAAELLNQRNTCRRQDRKTAEILGLSSSADRPAASTELAMTAPQ